VVDPLDAIIQLAEQIRARPSLEDLLQQIAEGTAAILGVERVSVRLLDPTCKLLLAVARAGQSLHAQPVQFEVGEGLLGWIVAHNRTVRADDGAADPRFAPRPGMTAQLGGFLGVPIRAGAQCTGVISAVGDVGYFDEHHERLLGLIAALCGPYVEIGRLARLSRVDPLTGSLNRRGLDDAFPEVAADPDAPPIPMAVAMVDLDRFKAINDRHGHATGDVVLRHVVDVIGSVLRADDAVVRYGGEEFLVVLPKVRRGQAERIAERARAAVAAAPAMIGDLAVAATVSIGVAERHTGESRDEVIARADAALYRAKTDGRNRVALAG